MKGGFSMIDISERTALVSYLAERKVFKDAGKARIHYFSGGVSGTVALAAAEEKVLIVKQALAKLKVKADWFSDPARMKIEHDALVVYADIVPGCVPKPVSYDEKEYIQIREAAPESCPMWKTQLLDGLLDFTVAAEAVDALRAIHDRTATDERVRSLFANKQFFYNLRISPYIERVAEKHPSVAPQAAAVIDFLMNTPAALVHGDYSPKNILVDGRKIFILDFEVAHFGHPAFDVAFFSNHFLLKAVKRKEWSGAYLSMLEYMLGRYFPRVACMDARKLESETARTLAILFLARVDGKSPAEYITEEADKDLIRSAALEAIGSGIDSCADMIELVRARIGKSE